MKELIRWAAAVKNSKAAGIKGWKVRLYSLFFIASHFTTVQLNLNCLLLKVLYFRNKMTLKNSLDDDEITSSSKISFAWDAGSCSTSSSVFSPLSLPLVSRLDHQMSAKNTHSSAVALQSSNSNASTLTTLGFSLGSPETEGCSRGGQWITSDSDCKFSSLLDFKCFLTSSM